MVVRPRRVKPPAVKAGLSMGDNGKFEFTATLEPDQAGDYLRQIADGLRRGIIGLSAAGRSIRLEPGRW